jgi:hypothetical protein
MKTYVYLPQYLAICEMRMAHVDLPQYHTIFETRNTYVDLPQCLAICEMRKTYVDLPQYVAICEMRKTSVDLPQYLAICEMRKTSQPEKLKRQLTIRKQHADKKMRSACRVIRRKFQTHLSETLYKQTHLRHQLKSDIA